MVLCSLNFYSHVNYSVTKIYWATISLTTVFYSHVNYSVTKITPPAFLTPARFYSHVNYSVTKIVDTMERLIDTFTVT